MTPQNPQDSWTSYLPAEMSVPQHASLLGEHVALLQAVVDRSARRIVEMGCGTGIMSLFLAARGFDVLGVDVDEELIRRARTLARFVPSACYQQADGFRLAEELGVDSFDCVFSQGVMEHFDDDQVRRLTEQQLEVAPRVVFSVPSDQYPQQDFGNERLLSPGRWLEILRPVGTATASYYGVRMFGLRESLRRKLRGELTQPQYHVLVVVSR